MGVSYSIFNKIKGLDDREVPLFFIVAHFINIHEMNISSLPTLRRRKIEGNLNGW
jgi:hypothetical protein